MAISSDYFNDFSKMDYMERQMREKERYMMEQMRAMQNMAPQAFIQSGSGAADVVASKPKKPAFLNQKLLLTKGS